MRLPIIYGYREHIVDGGLISYGVDLRDCFRRSAVYVVRILNGTAPGDLPVEFPTKLELIINLKTAKALAIEIPPSGVGPHNSPPRLLAAPSRAVDKRANGCLNRSEWRLQLRALKR